MSEKKNGPVHNKNIEYRVNPSKLVSLQTNIDVTQNMYNNCTCMN